MGSLIFCVSFFQDYEFNSFDISLASEDPLNPGVVLSGEVEGLKPPAVADKPMEPRLFVVNRAAEATEVVSACVLMLVVGVVAQAIV